MSNTTALIFVVTLINAHFLLSMASAGWPLRRPVSGWKNTPARSTWSLLTPLVLCRLRVGPIFSNTTPLTAVYLIKSRPKIYKKSQSTDTDPLIGYLKIKTGSAEHKIPVLAQKDPAKNPLGPISSRRRGRMPPVFSLVRNRRALTSLPAPNTSSFLPRSRATVSPPLSWE